MNRLRRIHLYLGSFFAPMIVLFCISGIWQVLGYGEHTGPSWLQFMTSIHMGHDSKFLKVFIILMAACLVLTIFLGVAMAFKFGRGLLTLACLAAGIIIPLALINFLGR